MKLLERVAKKKATWIHAVVIRELNKKRKGKQGG
jgi:hypothetical protein